MLWLANARDRDELRAWDARVHRLLGGRADGPCATSPSRRSTGWPSRCVYERRPPRARRHARRRGRRRGRHRRTCGRCAPCRCGLRLATASAARAGRGARRGVPARGRLRAGSTRSAPRPGHAMFMNPRNCAAGSLASWIPRSPPASARAVHLCARRARRPVEPRGALAGPGLARAARLPRSTRSPSTHDDIDAVIAACAELERAPRDARLRDRRRRREGRPATSSSELLGARRPRAALGDRLQVPADAARPRSCTTSASTSGAPAA